MSENSQSSTADLAMLSRRPSAEVPESRRRRHWQALLPVAILLGFALLFLLLFGDRLWPAAEVRVSPVLAVEAVDGEVAEDSGAVASAVESDDVPMLFQASGWIEPDPLPIKATVLVDGVIDEVHVLEGQEVKKGELIATLNDEDAQLALMVVREELLALRHGKDAHCAGITVVESKVKAAEARAEADKALLGRARDQLERLESVKPGAVPITELIEGRFAVDRLVALADESAAKVGELRADLERINLEVPMMEARIRGGEAHLAEAELALARTRVPSPVDGRVLRLLAAPGQKRMLGMDDLDSATVAILYQPDQLQVRVDVPLADAAGLSVGQGARIRSSFLPDKVFRGEVSRIVGEADIQRNTLQAKVRLIDPLPQLRPDMLCRVEFLAGAGAPGARSLAGQPASLTLFVPESALVDDGAAVWVCDRESRRVQRREVTAGSLRRDGHRQVVDGLRPGEWVVLEPSGLADNRRVKPQGHEL